MTAVINEMPTTDRIRQIALERIAADKRDRYGTTIEIVGRRLAWGTLLVGRPRRVYGIEIAWSLENRGALLEVRRLIGWTVGWLLSQGRVLEDFASEDGFDAIEAILVVAQTQGPREQGIYHTEEGPSMRVCAGQGLEREEALAWARVAAAAEIEVRACFTALATAVHK